MTWTQYNPEIFWEEFKPARSMRVRKQIWDAELNKFVPVTFVRFYLRGDSRDRAREYHFETYGEAQYLGAWWWDDSSIWLRESLATFWTLKNP